MSRKDGICWYTTKFCYYTIRTMKNTEIEKLIHAIFNCFMTDVNNDENLLRDYFRNVQR